MSRKITELFKTYTLLFCIIVLAFASIQFTDDIKVAASVSIKNCLTLIIPSMYGFMIIACFVLKSNLHTIMGKPFNLIAKYLFRISSDEFSIFLISIFSGYPVGVKIIYELESNGLISKKRAENLSCYCYSSGPAFIVGTVATKLYRSIEVGMIIFLSIIISNIITGIVIALLTKERIYDSNKKNPKLNLGMDTFVNSVQTAAKSLFEVCIMVLMFSIFYTIIFKFGIITFIAENISRLFNINTDTSQQIVASFFEISNISFFKQNNYLNLPVITGLLSFGGICVIIQIIAISRGKVNIKKFLLARIFSSINAAIICKVLTNYIFKNIAINTFYDAQVKSTEYSIIPSLALLLMTIILLLKND